MRINYWSIFILHPFVNTTCNGDSVSKVSLEGWSITFNIPSDNNCHLLWATFLLFILLRTKDNFFCIKSSVGPLNLHHILMQLHCCSKANDIYFVRLNLTLKHGSENYMRILWAFMQLHRDLYKGCVSVIKQVNFGLEWGVSSTSKAVSFSLLEEMCGTSLHSSAKS